MPTRRRRVIPTSQHGLSAALIEVLLFGRSTIDEFEEFDHSLAELDALREQHREFLDVERQRRSMQ